jgi:hypothetical protein
MSESLLISFAGIVVTFMLGIISDRRNRNNTHLEHLKQRPLLNIETSDFSSSLMIVMKNKGIGPLLIMNYVVQELNDDGSLKEQHGGLWYYLPKDTECYYDNFSGNQDGSVLSPAEESVLLDFSLGVEDNEESFEHDCELIRESLKNLKIVVTYKDVYDNVMPVYEKALSWFGDEDGSRDKYLSERADRGSREHLREVLGSVPDVEPEESDRL